VIAKVLKEVPVLLETCVQPGELIQRDLGVSGWISGIGHVIDGIGRRRQNPRF
jgi:hypothetical protein